MARQAEYVTLEGRNMVKDALASGQKITSVLISEASVRDPKIKEIEELAKKKGIRTQNISAQEMEKIAESRNPQGVIGTMEIPQDKTLEEILKEKRNVFLLLLTHIDYEQNLGAILRTAWGAGVDAVIVGPSGVHEITPVVAKVSMGGAAYVPLISMSMFQTTKLLHKYAVPVVGVEVGMGKEIYESKLTGPIALVMGSEAEGISEPLQKECDFFVKIPMRKELASLNVSVATALVVYEKVRQERVPG